MGNCFGTPLDNFDNSTPQFSLDGLIIKAKVVDVYDGDTITCVFETFKGQYYSWKIRVNYIDTPEIKTKKQIEKQAGLAVKKYVSKMILGKVVKLKCGKFEKYGRLLGDIEYKGVNLSNHLLEKRFAYKYGGATKKEWTNSDLSYIISSIE